MFTPITNLDKHATQEEAIAKVAEIKRICEEYELEDRNFICWDRVHDTYKGQIEQFEFDANTLDECTADSRQYVIRFINFFIEQFNIAINGKIRYLNTPKTTLRVRSKEKGALKDEWGIIEVATSELDIYISTCNELGLEYEVL